MSEPTHVEETETQTPIPDSELADLRNAQQWLADILAIMEEQQRKMNYYDFDIRTPPELLRLNLARMEKHEERHYHNAMAFRDQMIAQMRALEIVIDSVLMATTHREKDARLRGVLDVINVGIQQLNDMSKTWMYLSHWPDSLLRSDSSIPRLQRRTWKLEEELARYREKYGTILEEEEIEDDESPF